MNVGFSDCCVKLVLNNCEYGTHPGVTQCSVRSLKSKNCCFSVTECIVYMFRAMTLYSFLSCPFFLFDWVGVLWPQLSKVLKPVCWAGSVIVQELCESRGERPGLSVLTSLLVSVDVQIY